MSRELTSKELDEAGSSFQVLSQPLHIMDKKERRKEFWQDHWLKIGIAAVLIIAFSVTTVVFVHPKTDVTVVWITSSFIPSTKIDKSVGLILESMAPDVNQDGASIVKVFTVYNAPSGKSLLTDARTKAESQKLSTLLASGDRYMFIVDAQNAKWLYDNGYTTTSDVSTSMILFTFPPSESATGSMLAGLASDHTYTDLLTKYYTVLPKPPVASADAKRSQLLQNEYAGAQKLFKYLTTGVK